MNLFKYCYQWYPQWLRIEKQKKICYEDHGSYILLRLPSKDSIDKQDNFLMQCFEYMKKVLTDLRSH